jgi:HrpA-like RNA helicase
MRIILSTNVIETGFTIPDLSYVIDTLKYLQAYYNPVTKMDILRFLPVSISMHQQRKGRVGRVQGGVYIALAPQSVVAQLKREESCIRYTDIKQLLLEMGNLFYKLEFIQPIP